MSKAVKRKISVELTKPRDLSRNRLSVFQRLGTKKSKSIGISESKSIPDDLKQTLSAAVSITTKPISLITKPDHVELEDADQDILERKRLEIQKELELQLKMESRRAAAKEAAMRKRKRQPSSSSSSSSSSNSGTSSSTSSSSSSDDRHKVRKAKCKRRDSSSSSDDLHAKKSAKKRLCQSKKEALKLQKSCHSKKLQMVLGKSKKRSISPMQMKRLQSSSSSSTIMVNSKGQKVLVKNLKVSTSAEKHHRMREKESERENQRELLQREKEREKERMRLREKERIRSRSPKMQQRSRSPKREFNKLKSPPLRRLSPAKPRLGSQSRPTPRRMDSRERERRDKERQEREAAREKERREALARCQERQRERERLAKEKTQRLLPRPAERAMALAAARDRSRESLDRERHMHAERGTEKDNLAYSGRGYAERTDSYEHMPRHEKDAREHDRDYGGRHRDDGNFRETNVDREPYDDQKYENHSRRDDRRNEYQSRSSGGGGSYIDEQHQRSERDREWIHEDAPPRDIYDRSSERHQSSREWDHKHRPDNMHGSSNRDNYSESKEWAASSDTNQKWENRKSGGWQQDAENKWNRYGDDNWKDQNQLQPTQPQSQHTNRNILDKPIDHGNASTPTGKPLGGAINRRWNSWRGRGRGSHHHTDFRRTNVHHHHNTEILEERGEIYRRHINPQASNTNSTDANKATAVSKPAEPTTPIAAGNEKPAADDHLKANADDTMGEEIADDLSEISDEADDILGQQEEHQEKVDANECVARNVPAEPLNVKPIAIETKIINETEKEMITDEVPPSLETPTPAKLPDETPDRPKDISDEIDLDFEEISDGELEEEARIKGLGDALGVDWASLIEESKAITQEKSTKIKTSAKQRWQPHRILLDVGISYKMAGATFAQTVLSDAHQKLQRESQPKVDEVKENVKIAIVKMETSNDEDVKQLSEIKSEIDVDIGNERTKCHGKREVCGKVADRNLQLHRLPCVQVSAQNVANKHYNLVFNATGPYSRALCVKRDMAMRRQLCNLPINENNCKASSSKASSGYENIAIKLFQKALQA